MTRMLGRTASGLFWMMRYIERLENTARLIDVGHRMSLTRSRSAKSEWESVLTTAGVADIYAAENYALLTRQVVDFLIRHPANPNSLLSSLTRARENARATRTALTRDVWEAVNGSYMELKALFDVTAGDDMAELPATLAEVKRATALIHGTVTGTMLRNDIYRFCGLGKMIERVDNTARILDTKYYLLLPSSASVGSSLDQVQWEMVLRSASAERGFRWLHGGRVTPADIVDFLVKDTRLPRSVAYSYTRITQLLSALESEYGRRVPAHDMAESHLAELEASSHTTIIRDGLHEFLQAVIDRNAELSNRIETDFRFHG